MTYHTNPALHRRLRIALSVATVMALAVPSGQAAKSPELTLKFAMLAPDRSVWSRAFDAADEDVRKATENRVGLKVYPGGVQGDEPTVIRKMRIGQLHGAAFMGRGINLVCPDTTVLALPLLFESEKEVEYVLDKMTPFFQEQARKNGYEILGWTMQGFAYLFSRNEVRDVDGLRSSKPWLMQDDIFSKAFFDVADIRAIPAQVGDVMMALQSGLVETVFSPPLGMIALQWHTRVTQHLDLGLFYSFGAVVVSQRQWRKISDDDQKEIKEAIRRHAGSMNDKIAQQNAEAMTVLGKTVKTVKPTDSGMAEFRRINAKVAERLRGDVFSEEAYKLATKYLSEYRQQKP